MLSALVNPLLWLIFLTSNNFMSPLTDRVSAIIALLGLLGGNLVLTGLAISAPRKRGWNELAPYGFTVAFYWALISIAAWRGLSGNSSRDLSTGRKRSMD